MLPLVLATFNTTNPACFTYRPQNGRHDQAGEAAGKCRWQHWSVVIEVALLRAAPREQGAVLKHYADAICAEVNPIREQAFARDIMHAISDAGRYLAPTNPELASSLWSSAWQQVPALNYTTNVVRCVGMLTAARAEFDRQAAAEQWEDFVVRYAPNLESSSLKWLFETFGSLAPILGETIRHQLRQYRVLLDFCMDDKERFEGEAAYICALARLNPNDALIEAGQLVDRLQDLNDRRTSIPHLERVIGELTGDWAGGFSDRPTLVTCACHAVLAAAGADTSRGAALLERIFQYVTSEEDPGVRAKATAQFFSCLAYIPVELRDPLAPVVESAAEGVVRTFDAGKADETLLHAVAVFTSADRFETAETLTTRLQSDATRAQAAEEIMTARSNAEIDVSGPFEAALVNMEADSRDLAFLALRTVRLENNPEQFLQRLLVSLADKEIVLTRYRLLQVFAPIVLLPLLQLGPPTAANETVAAIDDFDARLIRAAMLIAAQT